jgi:hypothetical protein
MPLACRLRQRGDTARASVDVMVIWNKMGRSHGLGGLVSGYCISIHEET